jgi:hypothetical protein
MMASLKFLNADKIYIKDEYLNGENDLNPDDFLEFSEFL